MTAALRIVTDSGLGARLDADATITARACIVTTTGHTAMLRTAARAAADVAAVQAGVPGASAAAIALRAAGVPVWWIDALQTRCPGYGAPAVTSARPDAPGLSRLSELAAHPGAGRTSGPPVSVVVTTLDEGPALAAIVADVAAELGPDDEFVVVDGGSSDGSVDEVRAAWAHESRIRIVDAPGAGISQGRNIGVRTARHDIIACTDAGCAVQPGWLDALRMSFVGPDVPGLVSGVFHPVGPTALDRAQALACYVDPHEVERPDLAVRLYTRVFGTGFDPAFSVGRNMAFTRDAWREVGGFREDLPTGEDVSFGLAVAGTRRVVGSAPAAVSWVQRPSLRATWRMYRSYGRASTDGGDARLLVRDGVRGVAYLGGLLAVCTRRGRPVVAAGALAYLSLPVRRALRQQVPATVYALLPVAIVTKDLGKLVGAVEGFVRARRGRR